jgi:hypothetical protein
VSDQVELLFQFNTQGASQLDTVEKIVQELGKSSALTSTQIAGVESVLNSLVKSGESVSAALNLVAGSSRTIGVEAANAAKALLEQATAASTVAASSNNAAKAISSVGTASETSIPKMAAASAALRGLDGSMNLRAAERFLSTFQGLGPVLQSAFPLFGALAFVEILEQGVDKVGKLYNAWDPVLKAEKDSLKILQDSTRELESMISKSERLTLETRKRQFGTQFEDREKGDNARLDAIQAQALIDQIKQQIADTQARVTAGAATGPQAITTSGGATVYAPGRGETTDAKAAREKLIGLDAQLEDAIYKAKLASQEAAAADADVAKDRTDKARESARKVDAINKQIEAVMERSAALADRAELGTGPLADIEVRRRAENRRYSNEKSDLAVQVRDNSLGGPDTVRTPQSSFTALGQAQDSAHALTLASLDTEKVAAIQKEAEKYADVLANINHEWDQWEQHLAGEKLKNAEQQILALVKAHDELVKATEKSNRVAEVVDKADEADLQLQFKKSTRLAELSAPIGSTNGALDAAANAYQQRLVLIKQIDDIEQRGIDREAALSTLKGTEYDKDLAVAQERLKLTQEEGEAAVDYAIKVAEIERKRIEDARSEAGKVFDALVSGGKTSFADFARGIALTQGKAIFENVTEGLFKSAGTTLGGIIPKDSPLAGLFKGTLLEPQEKVALDVHTQAMLRHAAALEAALGGGFGGGSVGSLPLGTGSGSLLNQLGIFGSDTNGLTGQGPLGADGNSYTDLPLNTGEDTGVLAGALGLTSKSVSPYAGLAKDAGYAAAVVGAGYGVYDGIKQGGARGTLGAVGSALGAASLIPGPQQPFVMAAALIAGMVKGLLPDPKAAFDAAQNKTLNNDKFTTPDPLSQEFDVATGASATNIATRWASSPVVAGSDTFNTNAQGQTRVIVQNVHFNVSAVDDQSVSQFFANNGDNIAKVVGDATRAGNPDMQIAINRVVFGPGAA